MEIAVSLLKWLGLHYQPDCHYYTCCQVFSLQDYTWKNKLFELGIWISLFPATDFHKVHGNLIIIETSPPFKHSLNYNHQVQKVLNGSEEGQPASPVT